MCMHIYCRRRQKAYEYVKKKNVHSLNYFWYNMQTYMCMQHRLMRRYVFPCFDQIINRLINIFIVHKLCVLAR